MKNASVPPDRLYGMLLNSVRYALGRRSYVVGEVCDWVRDYRKHLAPEQIDQIAKEVRHELDLCSARGGHLGMEMDHRTWEKLVRDLTD